ncbi:MAG: phosphate acyltransferase PlsX [Coriobacteriia bacterium]|jgi:glycerol-3-phosphate acyltransferase PlsX|nr:phosphate acyltransferase PlsX [Coriobacteriia bacterium]
MSEQRTVRVCVDAVGGDFAPQAVLAGVEEALLADPELEIVLVGPEGVVTPFAGGHDRVWKRVATQTIEMDEHPAAAVRTKKDSSIVVGCGLVRDGEADAFFSAGSTGACMAVATLVMGRIAGVARPAIATVLPTVTTPTVLLDVGANADCKPEHLVTFAHMGRAYAQAVLGVEEPATGLLNIGEEPTKGSALAIAAHALMEGSVRGFAGNIEGRDVLVGAVDVIVTDGFTGNVALKLLEGTSEVLLGQVKEALTSTSLARVAAGLVAEPLRRLKARLNPDTYGGAPLLGVRGVCIVGHGSSGSDAIAAGIRVAAQAVRGDLTRRIADAVSPGL